MERKVITCPECKGEIEYRYEVTMCILCGHHFSNWFLASIRWVLGERR